MKTVIFILFIILILQISINAQHLPGGDSTASSIPFVYHPVLIDKDLTMKSGAENLITLHKGIAAAEDYLIGTKWFTESNILGKTGGVLGRIGKYFLLDMPVDFFSIVLAHEYWGHGSRYRELDVDNIFYKFKLPPPYGGGGGEATNTSNLFISPHEIIAIWLGGVEVHPLIGRNLSLNWMKKNEINYREAFQYFFSFQIMLKYINETEEDLTDGTQDNDLRAYVRLINSNAGYNDVTNLKMSVKDLKSKTAITVVNPFIVYSIYTMLKTYFWDGNTAVGFPVIQIGDFGYLPSLRAGLTPFGVEYHFENYLRYKNTVSFVDLSYGDQTFYKSWGGIGVSVQNVYTAGDYSFDVNCNIWKQPGLGFGSNPIRYKRDGLGAAFSVRGYYDILDIKLPLSLVAEVGYKTTGFLEGYVMDSSPIIAAGIAIRN